MAVFLQVVAGFVLLRDRSEHRLAIGLFGVLFFLNAGASVIMALPREYAIWLASDDGVLTKTFRAFDAPSGFLLLAFVAARSALPRRNAIAWSLVGAGVLAAFLEFPLHRTMIEHEYAVRVLPLYLGFGLAAYAGSGGRPWERWIALGLLARMLYWGTAGVASVLTEGLGQDDVNVYLNRVGLLALFVMSLVCAARLLVGRDGPQRSIVLLVLATGPVCALFEVAVAASLPPEHVFRFGSVVVLNLVTLGLVRPLVTLAGIARNETLPALGTAALAGGLAASSTIFVRLNLPEGGTSALDVAIDDALAFGVGLVVGLLALAVVKRLRMPRASAREAVGQAPTTAPARPPIPHWQILLLALKDSCSEGRTATPVDFRLAQKGLVERTGLRASRISTLVRDLNTSAESRLDAYVPTWRDSYKGVAGPVIVEQYSGAIEGRPGIWTFYRLSRLGEALAEAIERSGPSKQAEFTQNSHPSL